MRKLFLLISLFPLFVVGQPKLNELSRVYSDTPYSNFDLSKIITNVNDFNQTPLLEPEIESRISDIIKSQNSKSLLEIVVPIDSKKLRYLGKIHPTKTNLFYEDYNYFVNNDQSIKGDSLYTYKYENLFIATKTNTLLDRYLVYYTIRAFLIIKYRLSDINKFLFEKTQQIPTNFLLNTPNLSYINTTKYLFITFDGTLQLPSNNGYFGTSQISFVAPTYGIEVYPNTQVIYFNRTTVLNGGAAGNIPIYSGLTEPSQKFHTYMKDGFIHSLIHERIHDWIFQYNNFNSLADYLRNKCVSTGVVTNYYPFEEAVVNNTTNILFEMNSDNGGLSDDILRFYRKEFELSIDSFKTNGSYQKLKAELAKYNSTVATTSVFYKGSISYKLGDDNKLFFIDFKSKQNEP